MKRGAVFIFFLVLLVGFVFAMPPPSDDLQKKYDDGTLSNPFTKELVADLESKGLNKPGDFDIKSFISSSSNPAQKGTLPGQFNALVILVDFSDKPHQTDATYFDHLWFDASTNSVKTFYLQNSYGKLNITPVDIPSSIAWIRLPQTYAYYVNNNYGFSYAPRGSMGILSDAVDLIDPYVDFSKYDNNGDGKVEGVMVVHAGRGAEISGLTTDIWSHKWNLVTPKTVDGVTVSSYSIQPEYWGRPGDMTIGVNAHEFGHILGLPDLYDLGNDAWGAGFWSLMAQGAWGGGLGQTPIGLDAWSKTELGFITPQTIPVSSFLTNLNIPPAEDQPVAYKLWKDNVFGKEYFLIENRYKKDYDTSLPGSGLLIWHIDESQPYNDKQWYPGSCRRINISYPNSACDPYHGDKTTCESLTFCYWDERLDKGHLKVALEQADGLWKLDKKINAGDSEDPFPGSLNKRYFNDGTFSGYGTSPDSKSYASENTFVRVENIMVSGQNILAEVSVSSNSSGYALPPIVSLTYPVQDSYVFGKFPLRASASDDQGIQKVEFYKQGVLIGTDTTYPYEIEADVSGDYSWSRNFYAKAYDVSDVSTTSNTLRLNVVMCGDINHDSFVDSRDLQYMINYLFLGGAEPVPVRDVADLSKSEFVDTLDFNWLIDTLYFEANPVGCNKVIEYDSSTGSYVTGNLIKGPNKSNLGDKIIFLTVVILAVLVSAWYTKVMRIKRNKK